jgi:hypothetical protein
MKEPKIRISRNLQAHHQINQLERIFSQKKYI